MDSTLVNCGVCTLRHISKPSEVWCSECDEGLCADCREHHGLSKGTRNHNTVLITEYQKLPSDMLKISQFCSKHEEKYQTYCKKHDCPCCRRCVIESHNDCKDLQAIDDIVDGVKKSNAFLELEQRFFEIAEYFQRIRQDRNDNLTNLKEQRTKYEKEVRLARTKINNHLDKIQKQLLDEISLKEEQESNKINQFLISLEKNENEVTTSQEIMTNIKQHGSNLQTFFALKQLENDVAGKEEFLHALERGESLGQIVLTCNLESGIATFATKSSKFGEILVEAKPANVFITKKKERQAQIFVPKNKTRSIENVTLSLKKKLNTFSENVTGCLLRPDGRTLFSCDTDEYVTGLNTDGKEMFKIELNSWSTDMTFTEDDNIVAVSSYEKDCLYVIDLNAKKVIKTIPVSSVFGITYRNNQLIFTTGSDGIRSIDFSNDIIQVISAKKLWWLSYVTTNGDNIYVTGNSSHTVTCYDLKGTRKWEFKDVSVLKQPIGITSDNNKNIYVVGNGTKNLVIISSDGTKCRELLNEKDGLINPWTVHYQRKTNQLLISNYGKTAFLYNVQ